MDASAALEEPSCGLPPIESDGSFSSGSSDDGSEGYRLSSESESGGDSDSGGYQPGSGGKRRRRSAAGGAKKTGELQSRDAEGADPVRGRVHREPIHYFRDFFNTDLLDTIVQQSNVYSVRENPNCPLKLDHNELEQFIGTMVYMSVVRLPKSRMYWSTECRISQVADVMSRDRWEEIKKFIHFNDYSNMAAHGEDKLCSIRPIIDLLLKKFRGLPKDQMLAIDDQLVASKGRPRLDPDLPKKPHRWGYKVFMLSDTKGLLHAFDQRFFFHFVDMILVNSWLLYRRGCDSMRIPKRRQKDLVSFRIACAQTLRMQGKDLSSRREWAFSDVEWEYEKKKHRGPAKAIPTPEVRSDCVGHWPVVESARQRCKFPNCKGQTVFKCSKCNVHLCLNKNNNCFREFHY